jgi:hypothetical protein
MTILRRNPSPISMKTRNLFTEYGWGGYPILVVILSEGRQPGSPAIGLRRWGGKATEAEGPAFRSLPGAHPCDVFVY